MPLEKITSVAGRGVHVPGSDIDTDRIIPARFMKCVTFDGLGEYAFYDERFDADGKQKPHPINDPRYAGASILLAGRNFGCGSSREHAPQALYRHGIRAVLAESFAETVKSAHIDSMTVFSKCHHGFSYHPTDVGVIHPSLRFDLLSLTGAFGGASSELSNLFSGPARIWSYGGAVIGPIFTLGAVSGQVAQAEATQRAALENYKLSIRNAFADVDNALVANQKLQQQLAAQIKLVAALQQYNELARLQYDGGYVGYSTVLQAEQALFPAELNLVSIRASVFASSVNIYKAMGGGWITRADAMTGNTPAPPPPSAWPPPLF